MAEVRGDDTGGSAGLVPLARRHLRFGWWSLLFFATLGLGLETLHGLKVGFYLDVSNETRRLLWTLAHAHGVLLSLLHLAFAGTLALAGVAAVRGVTVASRALLAASILLPGGFFAGGVVVHGGDPNLAILITPVGAALLLLAVFLTARATWRR